jgi:predicted RNase H-like nuclease (RuvC/YqgF family)
MQDSINIIFYSKYSKSCDQFLDIIKKNPIKIEELLHLKFINIDSPETRKRLLNAKNPKIDKVPCIVSVNNAARIQKYVDKEAFDWLRQIYQNELNKSTEQTENKNMITQLSNDLQSCGEQSNELYKAIEKYEEFVQELQTENQNLQDQNTQLTESFKEEQEKQLERNINFNKKVSFSMTEENETPIDDESLNAIDRNNTQLIDKSTDFGPAQEINRDATKKLENKDVMAAAEEIRKGRENE